MRVASLVMVLWNWLYLKTEQMDKLIFCMLVQIQES